MKIAFAATTADQDAIIDLQGARAPYYLLFETGSKIPEIVINPAAEEEHGAGRQAAEFLNDHQVEQVIAGNFGIRFREALEYHGIACIQKNGVISKAISEFET